jgi:hypothetical protein
MDTTASVDFITASSLVQDVVDRYPQTIIVLARQGATVRRLLHRPFSYHHRLRPRACRRYRALAWRSEPDHRNEPFIGCLPWDIG